MFSKRDTGLWQTFPEWSMGVVDMCEMKIPHQGPDYLDNSTCHFFCRLYLRPAPPLFSNHVFNRFPLKFV